MSRIPHTRIIREYLERKRVEERQKRSKRRRQSQSEDERRYVRKERGRARARACRWRFWRGVRRTDEGRRSANLERDGRLLSLSRSARESRGGKEERRSPRGRAEERGERGFPFPLPMVFFAPFSPLALRERRRWRWWRLASPRPSSSGARTTETLLVCPSLCLFPFPSFPLLTLRASRPCLFSSPHRSSSDRRTTTSDHHHGEAAGRDEAQGGGLHSEPL